MAAVATEWVPRSPGRAEDGESGREIRQCPRERAKLAEHAGGTTTARRTAKHRREPGTPRRRTLGTNAGLSGTNPHGSRPMASLGAPERPGEGRSRAQAISTQVGCWLLRCLHRVEVLGGHASGARGLDVALR